MSCLIDLPAELLLQIISHVETARDLTHFALSCRRFHQLIDQDGYCIFVQTKFPSMAAPIASECNEKSNSFWKDGAHALTTLSRNWDRKAFIAQNIGPNPSLQRPLNSGTRQSMGFIPVIDSHEVWSGGDWSSRTQQITWAAGAQLVFGTRSLGGGKTKWATYHEDGASDGRDDITSVHISKPYSSRSQKLFIGRANGDLAVVSFDSQICQFKRHHKFITHGKSVRSTALNPEGLLAACLSDHTLALYDPGVDDADITHISIIELQSSEMPGKTWVTRFLRNDRLVVGFGPSTEPIKIFDLNRAVGQHLESEPRSVSIRKRSDDAAMKGTSVYSIAPLPASTSAGGFDGDLFLSGGYDGIIRLHDLRCRDATSATFEDSVDYSPVYSLLSFGRERFVAGAASNSLIKVFDLRLPGGKNYYATDIQACTSATNKARERLIVPRRCCHYHDKVRRVPRGWNIFMGRGSSHVQRWRPSVDVPVYSLSKPCEYSPTFFVGTENRVLQVDLVAIMDKYPDSIYGSFSKPSLRYHDIQCKWDANHRVLSLPMYEHPEAHASVKLRKQREVGAYKAIFEDWDERWT